MSPTYRHTTTEFNPAAQPNKPRPRSHDSIVLPTSSSTTTIKQTPNPLGFSARDRTPVLSISKLLSFKNPKLISTSMAIGTLSHTSPVAARGSAAGSKKPRIISVRANLKQQRKGKEDNCTLSSSSMHTAEVLASRLGLDIAVAELERLFLRPGADPPDYGLDGGRRRPIRVAYQGVRGSYCHEAATTSFPSAAAVEAFPSGFRMEDAFSTLESGSADRAIIPAENSLDGPIDRNIDLLLRHPAVRITGELVVPVNHCLLAAPGVEISDLRRIVSHPQALGHCEQRLRSLDLEVEEVEDAAEAARAVAEDGIRDTAVIGSRIAAKEFGLRIMEQSLHNEGGNYNRFLQLGVGDGSLYCGENRKTTVAFSLEKGVSGLFRALWVFESRGIRVTKVDHRPNRANPVRLVNRAGAGEFVEMDYVFVVDVEGSELDPRVAAAVAGLGEISGFVRVLGSYACTCGA